MKIMMAMRSSYFILAFLLLAPSLAHGQKELFPEPGGLAEINSYYSKLKIVFKEAYNRNVDLKMILISSSSKEKVIYIEADNLVFLTPKNESIWHYEHQEMVKNGLVKRVDSNTGREIPPNQKVDYVPISPKRLAKIVIDKKVTKISRELKSEITKVWKDALLHSTHLQDFPVSLGGSRYHYSMRIEGKGIISAYNRSPVDQTILGGLNKVATALIAYSNDEVSSDAVFTAVKNYNELIKEKRR